MATSADVVVFVEDGIADVTFAKKGIKIVIVDLDSDSDTVFVHRECDREVDISEYSRQLIQEWRERLEMEMKDECK